MYIYFNNFWPGFLEGTNPNNASFFVELFRLVFNKNITVVNDYNIADILCESAPFGIENTFINKKDWKYSILVTGESIYRTTGILKHYNDFSCFLSGLKPDINLRRVRFPLYLSYLYCNCNKEMTPINKVPQKMVCAIISNPAGVTRNKFLNMLESRTRVDYGGSFRNNIGYCIGGDHNSNELINFIKDYKFVITMENYEEDYYITEKICNGLFAGTIPVYWGSPHIEEYFNVNRFLHLKNDSDQEMNNIIDKMLSITDEEYLNIVNSEVLIEDNQLDILVKEIREVLKVN